MGDLTGRTALVTGASRGIGRSVAERLASDGAFVAVHYGHSEDAARDTVAAIEKDGGRAVAIRAVLGDEGDVDGLFSELERALAGAPLDILVNNAGAHLAKTLSETTAEDFDRLFAVNVRAPFFATQRALPLLADGGRIINLSSANTRISVTTEIAYAMTKGALDVLGRTLAREVGAHGVTVNSVAAGTTETDMVAWLQHSPEAVGAIATYTALGRVGRPDDIASVVSFLASDDGRWVTGQVIDASGGLFIGPGPFRPG